MGEFYSAIIGILAGIILIGLVGGCIVGIVGIISITIREIAFLINKSIHGE